MNDSKPLPHYEVACDAGYSMYAVVVQAADAKEAFELARPLLEDIARINKRPPIRNLRCLCFD